MLQTGCSVVDEFARESDWNFCVAWVPPGSKQNCLQRSYWIWLMQYWPHGSALRHHNLLVSSLLPGVLSAGIYWRTLLCKWHECIQLQYANITSAWTCSMRSYSLRPRRPLTGGIRSRTSPGTADVSFAEGAGSLESMHGPVYERRLTSCSLALHARLLHVAPINPKPLKP